MRSIALFMPNWIGDAVMATPAIRAVRAHYPNAYLQAVCPPYMQDLFAGSPWFDAIVRYDRKDRRGWWKTVSALRSARTEAAVLFPNTLRSAALSWLAGCRTIVGFARYGRDALLTHRCYPTRDALGRLKPVPIIDDYNRLVERLGVPDPGYRLELHSTPGMDAVAATIWNRFPDRRVPVVGLNPGGAFGASKHWPTGHFVELSRMLVSTGCAVLVLCGPSERETARTIVRQANHPLVMSVADDPISLGLSKACVKRLSLLVTTDSGPRHFAAAFGVPVVTLFGPTHIGWTETYFDQATHLQLKLPCGPCQKRICPLGTHACMTDLTSSMVMAAVRKHLALNREARRAG